MKSPLHIIINDEARNRNDPAPSMSSLLENLNLNFIQVKDSRQFENLISYLSSDLDIYVWVHPNAGEWLVSKSPTSGEASAFAVNSMGIKDFNLISRYPNDIDENIIKSIGKEAVNVTEIHSYIIDHPPFKIHDIRNSKTAVILSDQVNLEFDVAILTALYDDEHTSYESFIEDVSAIAGFPTLKSAKLKGCDKRVLIDFQSKMGMVDATSLTTQIIEKFNPKFVIMTGVCGGRQKKNVRLMDLIIPDTVFDYQSGKYENGQFKPYLKSASIENKFIKPIASKILDDMKIDCNGSLKNHLKNVTTHYNSLACGNVVVKTDGFLEGEISKYDEQVVGVEMESYGVARAAELATQHKTKVLIIKSVMDYTEKEKNDNVKTDAAFISAAFTYYLIKDHLNI